ncbi:MAG: protoporphyrinogen oxidase, partial [Chloroflexota bacterium]
FILFGGELHTIPRGLRLIVPNDREGLLESQLLSEEGNHKMLTESEVPPRTETGDESLRSFMVRRFGEEALDVFGEPMLAGIYSGNPETMSMLATYPNYLNLEQKYGSVTKGTASVPPPPPTKREGPTSFFTSLVGGMSELVDVLHSKLTGDIRIGQGVTRIDPDGTVHTTISEAIAAEAVILTVTAPVASELLAETLPELSHSFQEFHTTSTGTISFGYKTDELPHPLDGFGFVVSAKEPTHLQACTWSSTKLSGRAPEGYSLLRVFVGGHRHPEDLALSDEELIDLGQAELRKIMGITAEPVVSRVFRWNEANPQYEVGHLERVAKIRLQAPAWLQLAGAPYGGVGIPDCIQQGRNAAKNIVSALTPA